jgi:hypothetical protein
MIMCTIDHYETKIGEIINQVLEFFAATDTVGQPNRLDVAHEQTLIAITIRANPASNLVFIES